MCKQRRDERQHHEPCQELEASSEVFPAGGGGEKSPLPPCTESHSSPPHPVTTAGFPGTVSSIPPSSGPKSSSIYSPSSSACISYTCGPAATLLAGFRAGAAVLVEQAGPGNLPRPEPAEPHSPARVLQHCHHIPSAVVAGQQVLHSIHSCRRRAGRQEDATLAAPEVGLATACPCRQPPFPLPGAWFCILALNLSSFPSLCFPPCLFLLPLHTFCRKTAFILVSAFHFKATACQPRLMLLIFVLEGKVNNHPPCLCSALPTATAFPG